MSSNTPSVSFADLNLPSFLLEALGAVGYETPSPIQAATIPALLKGRDVVGMAQTGTGKTAAFALPVLADIDVSKPYPQGLVLCPTRELAIQVAEAFQTYASRLRGFQVLAVYGGQDMRNQLKALKRGVHVIVGTPGRTLDHIKRKTLQLDRIKTLVLDEADEMLRMGFIDDVEAILAETPKDRRVALFSATMPKPIRKVAEKYLNSPEEVRIETKVTTNENIEQLYWLVSGASKLDALTRILEVEEFEGMIVFVRTKTATVELADKLNARGYSAAALNGDMSQATRIQTVDQLKRGSLDILVATDVAARGLDVERISHVMNYDIPYDDEAYVHRIGRTGRAGRSGKAILFVTPRERRLLRSIEKTTRKPITQMSLPTRNDLIAYRSKAFKKAITETIELEDLSFFSDLVSSVAAESGHSENMVASALAYLLQKDRPLQPAEEKTRKERQAAAPTEEPYEMEIEAGESDPGSEDFSAKPLKDHPDVKMDRFRVAVGYKDKVKPGQIVGAIANEAEIDGNYIGHIEIHEYYSTVDLPAGMPREILEILKKARVCNKPLNMELLKNSRKRSPSKTRAAGKPADTVKSPKKKKYGKKNSRKANQSAGDTGTVKSGSKKRQRSKSAQ